MFKKRKKDPQTRQAAKAAVKLTVAEKREIRRIAAVSKIAFMISHVPDCVLLHGEKRLYFKHFLSCKVEVQYFGSSDWLYSRCFEYTFLSALLPSLYIYFKIFVPIY